MRLRCLSCQHQFDVDPEPGQKPRCPRCLRTHGLVDAVSADERRQAARRAAVMGRARRGMLAGMALAVVVVGAVVVWRALRTRPAPDTVGRASVASVRAALVAAGIPEKDAVVAFASDRTIEQLARGVAGAGGPKDQAAALAQAIASRITAHGSAAPPGLRRPRAPRTAASLLAALDAGRAGPVGSYESACLALAAARELDLHAVPAEEYQEKLAGPSADPGGAEGRFVVLIYATGADGAPVAAAIDPLNGSADDVHERTPLSDLDFAARYYALRGLADAAAGDDRAALASVREAEQVAPREATVAAAEGVVDASIGDTVSSLDAWRRAQSLRDDPAREAGVGEALLAAGSPQQAKQALAQAVKADGALPYAHLALARIALLEGDAAAAAKELDAAGGWEPSLPGLAVARAELQAARGDLDGAEKALRGLASSSGPDAEPATYALVGLLEARGKSKDAQAAGEALVRRSPHPAVVKAELDELALAAPGKGTKTVAVPAWLSRGPASGPASQPVSTPMPVRPHR